MKLASLSALIALAAVANADSPPSGPLKAFLSSLNLTDLTPQILKTFLQPLDVLIERNSYVYRDGAQLKLNGKPWTASGANVYWLGLDENVIPPPGQPFYAPYKASYPTKGRITEVMNTLVTMGARTIRSQTLGISVGNPLSLMPALDQWNDQAFDTIDWAVYQARQHGLRIQAPLIDNYVGFIAENAVMDVRLMRSQDYYHGGKFDFLRFRGINISAHDGYNNIDPRVMEFYTNATIVNDFKNYIKKLITHVNPYTGLSYAEDPTIYAYETGNELSGVGFADGDVPNEWTREIARFIKELAPNKLIMDGTYGINATHFAVNEVDIFSDHFYPPDNARLQRGIDLVATSGRTYMAGEYDWTGNVASASPLESFFAIIEDRQKNTTAPPVAIGSQFWSLFMHNVPNCNQFVNHSDGFSLQYGNPLNTPHNNTQISLVRQHLFRMQDQEVGAYLPAVACPGPEADYTYE